MAAGRALGAVVQRAEWPILGLAAPLLLFPGRLTPIGAALLAVPWLARRWTTGRWSVPTAAHRPIALLLVALVASLAPSVRLDYSAPKLWGLVLGLATFYACLHSCRSAPAVQRAAWLLVGAAVALAGVGLLGMATPPDKLLDDHALYAALPRLVAPVQSSTTVSRGIHPNELAGTLALLAPLVAALGARPGRLRWLAIPATALLLVALALTQSRAATAGVGLALAVGAVGLGGKRALLLLALAGGVAAQAASSVLGLPRVGELLASDAPSAGSVSLVGRVELWQRGVAMALDMPLTGIGLNTFPLILQSFYPTLEHPSSSLIPHVHDLYLQTILDLGLPGLAAFLAVVALAVRGGLAAARRGVQRPMAVGLLLGLLAHGVYSLVDAVTLGAKPGPLLWAVLGLLVALGGLAAAEPAPGRAKARPPLGRRGRLAAALGLLLALPLLVAPLALNGALVVLHRPRPPDAAMPLLAADLAAAARFAWGPYQGRVWAAQAVAARARGDPDGELAALARAAPASPWEPSLAFRLGELRLARGDRPGAVAAWRIARPVALLLERGKAAAPGDALAWFALAHEVDPVDWRPYAASANVALQANQPDQAAPLLAEALRLRGDQPARSSIRARLLSPTAPLDPDVTAPVSASDADLFLWASEVLVVRADLAGAVYAARVAALADPSNPAPWTRLASLWRQLGQSALERDAQRRAAALERRAQAG